MAREKFCDLGIFTNVPDPPGYKLPFEGKLPVKPDYQLVSPKNATHYAKYVPERLHGKAVLHFWALDREINRYAYRPIKYARIIKERFCGCTAPDFSITDCNPDFDRCQVQKRLYIALLFQKCGVPVLPIFRLAKYVPIERQLVVGATDCAISNVSEPPETIIKTAEVLKDFGVKRVLVYGTLHIKEFTEAFGGEVFPYKMTSNFNYKKRTKTEESVGENAAEV